jgi:carbonic anhydrase/acetyltransferase-like protein (isoleucine patch superfamily)
MEGRILMNIIEFQGKMPKIDPTAFIADTAIIIGDVEVGAGSSIWFGTVIRGDVAPVRIGKNVNIQENCVLHESDGMPLIIEDNVTIGHMCTLHACTIRSNSLIGMGSIVLDGSDIREGCLIGAGSLLSGGKIFESNQMIFGRPAKPIRQLTNEEHEYMKKNIDVYIRKAKIYKEMQLDYGTFKK